MAPPTTTLHDVPDKLLRLILQFLIASPLCLVRAAATCKRWRRLVANRRFRAPSQLSGFRRPHPVAGSYCNDRRRGGLVFLPSSSTPVDGRHFALDFLPGGSGSWEVVDSRCSVFLLSKRQKSGWRRRCFPDLLICEPLKRRYSLIPPMEEMKRHHCLGVFLDGCEDSKADWGHTGARIPKFKVICVLYRGYDGVQDDEEWVIQRSLGLMEATRGLAGFKEEYFRGGGALRFVTAGMRSVVLAPAAAETWSFSIDLDTMKVARCMHRTNDHASLVAYPCELAWPPDLRACKMRCTRNGRGSCAHICICHSH
uniref:Uncharacterized protein n=1 Tax=Avena sativa TaxID=4498 RepID=A0ACD5UXH1_AVESA